MNVLLFFLTQEFSLGYSGFGINVYWAHKILFFAPQHEPQLSVAGLVLRMGSPRKLRNTTEVEEFCQGFRVVEVFVGGGEGGVVQGVINVCYRPRVRLCGEERARLGPATSGTAESAASHSFLQSVQPLSGSLNLGFNSTRTSPENRTDQTLFFYHKNCRAPKNGSILVGDDFAAVFNFSSTSPNLPTSVCHSVPS